MWLQPPVHAGSSLTDFSTLKMEAIRFSEALVHTRSILRHIPEDGILLIYLFNYTVTYSYFCCHIHVLQPSPLTNLNLQIIFYSYTVSYI
jgi:hypothetical protein